MLNPYYRPETSNDVNLFKEKHKFMNTVFDKTSQNDRGKQRVREHEGLNKSQSTHQKLNSFYTESTNSLVSVSTTLIYVTSAKIE